MDIEKYRTFITAAETAYGCKCTLNVQAGPPAVVNDAEFTALARESCTKLLGAEHVKPLATAMVGDDMAEFLSRIHGVLGALGVRNEANGIVVGNHNPRFAVDEACLTVGAAAMAQMAWDYLNR